MIPVQALTISLFAVGLNTAFFMLLLTFTGKEESDYWDESSIHIRKLLKPIIFCPPCMSSVWGTILYWTLFANGIIDWLITIISAVGISMILINLRNYE